MKIDLFGNIIKEEEPYEVKVEKPSPFGFIDNIAKKNYPQDLTGYNPYITNLAFSQRKDTIFYASEMNRYYDLPERAQFDFYYYALPKKNLFSKWAKAEKTDYTENIIEYFNVSRKVALEYERILEPDQLKQIKKWCENYKGGRAKS